MSGQFASSAWAEIIAKAAVSPLGISALVVLVVGFVVLRRSDSIGARLTVILALLIFCNGLVTAAFYTVSPTVTRPAEQGPAQSPSPPQPLAKVNCGASWSGWIGVGGAFGNPCPH